MKYVIDPEDLKAALAIADSVIDPSQTIPILGNVLVDASENGVSFRATDTNVEVDSMVALSPMRAGATTVSAGILNEIAKRVPLDATIELSYDAAVQKLEVVAGSAKFELFTLPKEDFPDLSTDEYATTFTIASQQLVRLFSKSRFAVQADGDRNYLKGVYFHVAEGSDGLRLRCAATDGFKFAMIDTAAPEGTEGMLGVIVPIKTVNEVIAILGNYEDSVQVSVSERKFKISTGERSFNSKLVEGNYPDYSKLIPSDPPYSLTVGATHLQTVVSRVMAIAVSARQKCGIQFDLSNGELRVSTFQANVGSAQETIQVAYVGDKLSVKFDSSHLVQVLAQIETGSVIFNFQESLGAVLVREEMDQDAIYVFMPTRN